MPVKRRLFNSAIPILQKERQREREREARGGALFCCCSAVTALSQRCFRLYLSPIHYPIFCLGLFWFTIRAPFGDLQSSAANSAGGISPRVVTSQRGMRSYGRSALWNSPPHRQSGHCPEWLTAFTCSTFHVPLFALLGRSFFPRRFAPHSI